MMKAKELREKSSTELSKELSGLQEELFKLRMQKGVGQIAHSHAFKRIRRDIARIKTLFNESEKSV